MWSLSKGKACLAELKDQYSDRINFADKDCEEDDNKELCKSEVKDTSTLSLMVKNIPENDQKRLSSIFFDDMLERLSSK